MVKASEVIGVKMLLDSTMCGFDHQGWEKFHRNQLGDAHTGPMNSHVGCFVLATC